MDDLFKGGPLVFGGSFVQYRFWKEKSQEVYI